MKFSLADSPKTHMLTHTVERPQTYDICKKQFSQAILRLTPSFILEVDHIYVIYEIKAFHVSVNSRAKIFCIS